MVRCARCCLHNSIKLVNMVILLFGIGIIIYSLWLESQWHHRICKLPVPPSPSPRPWFIFTCLAIGIAVSLSTLFGYAMANYVGPFTLCAYIFIICCLLLIEAGAVIVIFFKMEWISEFIASVDKLHKEFVNFVIFHVKLTRMIVLLILAAQVNVVALAVIFWAIGMEPRTHSSERDRSRFTQSFLVPNFPEPDTSIQSCRRCGNISQEDNSRESLILYLNGVIRAQFQRRNVV